MVSTGSQAKHQIARRKFIAGVGITLGLSACASLTDRAKLLSAAANDNTPIPPTPSAPLAQRPTTGDSEDDNPSDTNVQDRCVVSDDERAFLNFIAECEGTASQPGNGYDTSLDYGRWLPGAKEQKLSTLKLSAIDSLQSGMLQQSRNIALYGGSSALGRYQIVRTTLRGLRRELKLADHMIFDARLQDRLALALARRRGASPALGKEWASLVGPKLTRAIALAAAAFDELE